MCSSNQVHLQTPCTHSSSHRPHLCTTTKPTFGTQGTGYMLITMCSLKAQGVTSRSPIMMSKANIVCTHHGTSSESLIDNFKRPDIARCVSACSLCIYSSLDPKKVAGKILVCELSPNQETNLVLQVKSVMDAGGSGVIFAASARDDLVFPWPLPVGLVSGPDAAAIYSYIRSTT